MTQFWCELAWLGGGEATANVRVGTHEGRITGVVTGVQGPTSADVRLDGLTVPGLVNVHSHAFQRALRGRTHSSRGDFWAWREVMYRAAAILDPDNYYELARATYGEMLEAGVCAVGEFHYVHHQPDGTPYDDPNAMGKAVIAAAEDAGIRITLLDTAYLFGGLQPDQGSHAELESAQIRFGDDDVHSWIERVNDLASTESDSKVEIGAAIHSVRAVDPDSIRAIADWADHLDKPLHVHASEQPKENEACLEVHGLTPIGLLDSLGALTANTTVVHGTHLTDDDIDLLANSGAACCLCPTTERDLADGIGPSERLAEVGIPLSLGSDSHAVIDLLEEARAVEMNQRVASLQRGVHSSESLMTMATANGADALHWPGGAIEVGGLADFTTIGLGSNRLAGTDQSDALASVVFGGTAADVRNVVIGGERVVVDGAHRSIDVAESLDKAIRSVVES